MALDPHDLDQAVLAFMEERHIATLTLVRPDGTPHVTPVGFSYDADAQLARIITWTASQKYRLAVVGGGVAAAVNQVDGGRWLTLEGRATATTDPTRTAIAEAGYGARYEQPTERPDRAAIELSVARVLGRA